MIAPAVPPKRRVWLRILAVLVLLFAAFIAKGYWNATRDPIIRTGTIMVADWPKNTGALKVLHLSDIHVAGPNMPPERLAQIVRQLNALKPDLIVIAGDLISESGPVTRAYPVNEVIAPLGQLRAPLGVVVAPGNHDHWFDAKAITAELKKQGITVLQNAAVRRGPIIIGGIDDDYSGHDDTPATFAAMAALGAGPRILVTHSPDIVPDLPQPVAAVFAGHTHCGQLVFPIIGVLKSVSRYGDRFTCGLMNDNGQRIVVGAGLGTSILPLRYGAPPDAWMITLKGSR